MYTVSLFIFAFAIFAMLICLIGFTTFMDSWQPDITDGDARDRVVFCASLTGLVCLSVIFYWGLLITVALLHLELPHWSRGFFGIGIFIWLAKRLGLNWLRRRVKYG